jgi:hypothetical protein
MDPPPSPPSLSHISYGSRGENRIAMGSLSLCPASISDTLLRGK